MEPVTKEQLEQLVEDLSAPRRRARQDAAHQIALIAREDPEALLPYNKYLLDALYRPEAQTRWEILDCMCSITKCDSRKGLRAADAAEQSLFDEDSASVRLAAFHYFCVVGSISKKRSDEVWPLIEDAILCFHGDAEYRDMLTYVAEFARGRISSEVKEALMQRMKFDAENGKGYIKTFSKEIYDACK